MQLVKSLIALLFVVAGVLFGALNREPVRLDFLFVGFEAPLGLLVLATLLAGAFIGGVVVTLFVVWPERRRQPASAKSGSTPG
jgi:uncharacterized integral membrane protein